MIVTPSLLYLNEEEVQAANGIAFHQKEVASLEARITSLLGTVGSLHKKKEEHQQRIRVCQSVLSLARRLPTEILGQIFEYCVYLHPPAPFILSQVCVAWRRATHGLPRLWSSLFIDCARPFAADRTAYWVSMSGSRIPLDIVVIPHDTALHSVMHALVPHASRWKSLAIDAVLPSHALRVLDIIRHQRYPLSVLETFKLTVHNEMDRSLDIRGTFTEQSSPRLLTVRLQSGSWSMASLPSQITCLSLVTPALWLPSTILRRTIQLLGTLPRLESFSFKFEFPDDGLPREALEPVGDVMLVMSHLQRVIFTGCHPLFDILAHLTLPSLQRLSLRETGNDTSQTPRVGSSFREMIARSTPPLTNLELHGIDMTDNDFLHCFTSLSTLEELTLHDSEIHSTTVRRLCSPIHNDSHWICPWLKRLDMRWCSQLSGSVLVELVEARLASSQTSDIAEVVVINCSSVREDDVLSLAEITVCRLKNHLKDFCYGRGCCINSRYRHRFMLRHAADLQRERKAGGRLEL